MPKQKTFEIKVSAYVFTRMIEAHTLVEAKRKVWEFLAKDGGYSASLMVIGRQIKWLNGKYPKDIGFEPVTEWK